MPIARTMLVIAPTLFSIACAGPKPALVRTTAIPAPVVEKLEGPTGSLQVRRIGHASVLLESGDARVLTDPWVTETSAYNIGEPLGMSVEALPQLTAVIASHGHYDHFDVVG